MSPDEYSMLRDMLGDHGDAVRQLVDRFDENLRAQNRIIRQVANAQAQAGVLNTRVTSVDRSLRDLGNVVKGLDDQLDQMPPERIAKWDGAAAILADLNRVKGWDEAARNLRGVQWLITRSWKAIATIGLSAGGGVALVVKFLGG